MISPYLNDILDQPNALRRTIDGLKETPSIEPFARDLAAGRLRRVVLTGMGSSCYAVHPLWLRLVAAGVNAYEVETSELIHYAPHLITPDSLVVAVSQSGESAEIVQLLEMTEKKVPLIAVTNTPDSVFAQRAAAVLATDAGEEFSVSCKTYLAALAALTRLGDVLLPGENALEQLAGTPEAAAVYLADWESHVERLTELLEGLRGLFLVGRGPSLAAVQTAGLIIKESAKFPAQALSSAAFRHGPFELVSPETFVLVYAGDPKTSDLNRQLYEDVCAAGGRAALVQDAPQAGLFELPARNTTERTLLEMLPAQMISLALARLGNIEPGKFHLASKVTRVE